MSSKTKTICLQYSGALTFTVLAVLCRALLDPWLGDYLPLQMLYGAVILSVWIGGYRPALLAMVLGYLACDFLFITPRGQFGFEAGHDFIGLLVYLVSCGILISFGEVIHTARRRLELQRRQLETEITRRRKAEEEQRQSVEALNGFIQSSPFGIALLDDQMRYRLVNEALAKMNGLPATEHVGKTVAEVVPEVAAAVEVMFRHVLQTGQAILAHEHEEETSPVSGVRRWWETSWFPLRDPQQQPIGVGIIIQEITERKRAEKALERERELLQTIIDKIPVMITQYEPDTKLLRLNPEFERVVGWSAREAAGVSLMEECYPDPAYREQVSQFMHSCQSGWMDIRMRTRDGHFIETSWANIRLSDQTQIGIGIDLTQRKRAEEEVTRLNQELLSRVEELQAILNVVPIGIGMALDAECRCITHNPYLSDILGVPVWKNASLSASPEERPNTYKIYRDGRELLPDQLPMQVACTGVEVRDFEVDVVRADGGRRKLLCYARPLLDAAGQVRGSVGGFLDITQRRQMEEALRQSEAQFRQLADAMPQIVWAARPDGYLDYYNERWYEYTGFPRGEFGQASWEPILHPEDVQRCVETYFGCIQVERPYQIEYRFKDRRTGGYRWFLGRAVPVRDEQGHVIRWFGTCTDIDETKKAGDRQRLLWEAAAVLLTTSEPDAMLQALFARIGPHLGLDAYLNFVVTETGDALRLISSIGITAEETRALRCLGFGQGICGAVAQQRQPITATYIQQSEDPKVQFVKPLGIRAYACNPLMVNHELLGTLSFASRTRDQFDEEDLEFLRTICHYVAVAYERLRLINQLREADRKKDEFLATLAHELRNPLAPIRNAVLLLRLKLAPQPEMDKIRDILDRQVQQLTRLVDDLLDVSRITRGKINLQKVRVPLAQVLASAVESARPAIEALNQHLNVELPTEPVYLDADTTRLAQVFLNLLNNAAKYTPPEGRIWLTAERRGSEVVVRVRDTGIGIPREMLPHIFEMFTQVDRSLERTTGGLGIGLTLVQKLVEMHGGRVEAHSAGPGQGSEFVVHLPVLIEAPVRGPAQPRGSPAVAMSPCRILVVDDNRDAADSLALTLRLQGHEVHTAYDGLEALNTADCVRPEVVLLDIGLPKLNGYDVARRLRAQPWGKQLILVALTGWGQEEDQRRSQEAGFDHHLTKPADPSALQAILAALKSCPGS